MTGRRKCHGCVEAATPEKPHPQECLECSRYWSDRHRSDGKRQSVEEIAEAYGWERLRCHGGHFEKGIYIMSLHSEHGDTNVIVFEKKPAGSICDFVVKDGKLGEAIEIATRMAELNDEGMD